MTSRWSSQGCCPVSRIMRRAIYKTLVLICERRVKAQVQNNNPKTNFFGEFLSCGTSSRLHPKCGGGVGSVTPNPGYLDMINVPLPDFTRRLRMVLNTYHIASLAPQATTGTIFSSNATLHYFDRGWRDKTIE